MRHLGITDSEIIEAIGFELTGRASPSYSSQVGVLEVVFKAAPNMIYRYEDVTVDDFVALVTSDRIGKLFIEKFKKTKHPFVKSERPLLKKA